MAAPRRPHLIIHRSGGYSWAWPDDPENRAEDERIADVYHRERMRKKAIYDAKRAEYLAAVEAGRNANAIHACPECGEPVYDGAGYCSIDCEIAGESRPITSDRVILGFPMGSFALAHCAVCNRPMTPGVRGSDRKYCSTKCKKKAAWRRQDKKRKRIA